MKLIGSYRSGYDASCPVCSIFDNRPYMVYDFRNNAGSTVINVLFNLGMEITKLHSTMACMIVANGRLDSCIGNQNGNLNC